VSRKFDIQSKPGKAMSCQTEGSVRDCMLCKMSLSKGRGGLKYSASGASNPCMVSICSTGRPVGAKGSATPPAGANCSNDMAACEGGGERE